MPGPMPDPTKGSTSNPNNTYLSRIGPQQTMQQPRVQLMWCLQMEYTRIGTRIGCQSGPITGTSHKTPGPPLDPL